ncbi:MAG: 2-polyprenylphenol 6-hydroxylase [Pseudomonadota bacterium]
MQNQSASSGAKWRFTNRVLRMCLRYRLDLLVPADALPSRAGRFLLRSIQTILREPELERGERLRQCLVELGPVYIKLGQLLSTRRDLIPPDIADELSQLQDQVPPIPDFDVNQFVTEQLGRDPVEFFQEIEQEPMASASIAQVHGATLKNGDDVVVKLVRPGIEAQIKSDMTELTAFAHAITNWIPESRRLQLIRVCEDHETVLLEELDMFHEARNQIQLRLNFADSKLLYVPKVHRQFTRASLLVMERVYAPNISELDRFQEAGVDMQVLAHKGVETFFLQVFEHNFFHADMHPGNILVDISDPSDPKYIALDCAIIGTLTEEDQTYLAKNLIAFFARDYKQVVELHLESGWVPAHTNADEFERVIREVCEPIFAKPLEEISFGEFVLTLFQTAGQFEMEIQPQLVLLQKTLLYIEGLGRQLYPQLDLWETAQPFMESWGARHMGPAAAVNQWLQAGPGVWQQLGRLPEQLSTNQHQLNQLKQQLSQQHQSLSRVEGLLTRSRGRTRVKQVAGVGFVALSLYLLWQPLAQGIGQGDLVMLTGVVSAFLGSALLIKS